MRNDDPDLNSASRDGANPEDRGGDRSEYPPLEDDSGTKRFASVYARVVERMDADFLASVRKELLTPLTGTVVEIGAGTGSNIPHYSPQARVELLEPFESMRTRLEEAVAQAGRQETMTVSPARAEALPHADHSVDTIVSTLVLCSVTDPDRVLAEISRVLRPGGKLVFVEHSRGRGLRRRFQRAFEPLQRHFAGNCHLTRDMPTLLNSADFAHVEYRELGSAQVPLLYRLSPPAPFLVGRASKPDTTTGG